MPHSDVCPICTGAGMIGSTSCGKCRGTGRIKILEETRAAEPKAAMADAAEDGEEAVDLSALVHPRKIKVKIPKLKVAQSAGRRLIRGLSFKH